MQSVSSGGRCRRIDEVGASEPSVHPAIRSMDRDRPAGSRHRAELLERMANLTEAKMTIPSYTNLAGSKSVETACRVTLCERTPSPRLLKPPTRRRQRANVLAIRSEPVERHPRGPTLEPGPLSNLPDLTADLAAPCAFTAAVDAADAVGYSDTFVKEAASDYRTILGLKLGEYPAAGQPIDPSPQGPLGSLADPSERS